MAYFRNHQRQQRLLLFSNGVKVYHLSYGNVTGWIPPVSADTLPWQYPVLSVEVYENGEYYQTTLDGRPIKNRQILGAVGKVCRALSRKAGFGR